MNFIEELKWRGLIHQIIPGTEELFEKEQVTAYIGFDPTAESLHIGSLVPILLLIHLQKNGHKPIALIGGATGMIGDPSGKSEERNLLSEETLQKNQEGIRLQLSKFLNFSNQITNTALLVNNYDWFKEVSFLQFLRDTGKHITVNYMMAKESVKKRIDSDNGISFTEFSYQLIQAYDFYWLFTHYACKLQMGGSDQWGNITTGIELIRKKTGEEVYAFTCPLITKADGGKFGKTEQGNVWLDASKTSPYQFYQFWLNASDEDAEKWIKIFTFLPPETIEKITHEHEANKAQRLLQKTLAAEVTQLVHGAEGLQQALAVTEKLFSSLQHTTAEELSLHDLESMEGVVKSKIPLTMLQPKIELTDLLIATHIFPSKGEAKKMILNGGLSLNKQKIEDIHFTVDETFLLHHKYLLLQKGKKHFYLIEAI
jgi:tyrosyl-tRNA synthetase